MFHVLSVGCDLSGTELPRVYDGSSLRSSWFLGHVPAGEGKVLVPLNSPLGRRAGWTHKLGRKENYPSRNVVAAA